MLTLTSEAVDTYLEETLLRVDLALETALLRGKQAGLPDHSVSPLQGQFLTIVTRATKANRVLEIGTLAGYSTICFARGLGPNGKIITLEADPMCIEAARTTFSEAGLTSNIDVLAGDARTSLQSLIAEAAPPFDIIFIDADKPSNPAYLEAALKLSKPGTLIIGDNVVREGAVADADSADPKILGIRTFLDAAGQNRSLISTAMQTVGSKGHDGFALLLVV